MAPAALQRLSVLIASLQRNYPRIVLNASRVDRVVRQSAPSFVASLNGVGSAASNVGLTAVACVTRAALVAADIVAVIRQPFHLCQHRHQHAPDVS